MKEIVLDTETTGLSVRDGHRIVEIGCIELDNLIPTHNKFHCYLNPQRKVSKSASETVGSIIIVRNFSFILESPLHHLLIYFQI